MIELNGLKIAEEINNDTKTKISKLKHPIKLVVINVGNNEQSKIYIEKKEELAKKLNIEFQYEALPKNIEEDELISLIKKINNDNNYGIILQSPLPKKFNYQKIVNNIDPLKDIDGLTIINQEFLENNKPIFIPPTAMGVLEIFSKYNINLKNKYITVIGKGIVSGKPIATLLKQYTKNLNILDENTKNIFSYTKKSDIIISCAGHPNLLSKKDNIKENSILINVGMKDDKGDINVDILKDKTYAYTPLKNGIGPLTVSFIFVNLLKSYKIKNNISEE